MNRALFIELSKRPDQVEAIHSEGLAELVKSFPFFQAAKALYCISLKKGQEIGYSDALKSAALHTSNRKRLFELLEKKQEPHKPEIAAVVEETVAQKSAIDLQFEAEERIKNVMKQAMPVEEIIRQIVEYPIILDESSKQDVHAIADQKLEEPVVEESVAIEFRDKLNVEEEIVQELNVVELKESIKEETVEENSFLFWLKKVAHQPDETKPKPEVKAAKEEVLPSKSKEELIDMFIKTEPRISAPQKVEFYSPTAMSKKSSEDSEEIVSETLAKIYETQGNTGKAIRIYQKLSLLYPEKISYFAARIKNLEKTDLL